METNIEAIIDEYINHILTFGTAPTSDWLRTQLTFLLSKQLDEVVEEVNEMEQKVETYTQPEVSYVAGHNEALEKIKVYLSHQRELLQSKECCENCLGDSIQKKNGTTCIAKYCPCHKKL